MTVKASDLLRPSTRPFLIPYCATCEVPVLKFSIDSKSLLTTRFTVNAECHGRTEAATIPIEQAFAIARGEGRLIMFRPRGRATIFEH